MKRRDGKNCGKIDEIVHEMNGFDDSDNRHHQSSAADFSQIYTVAAIASMAVVAAAYPTDADSSCVFPPPRCPPSSLLPNFSQKSPAAFMALLGLLGDVNPSADGSAPSAPFIFSIPWPLPPLPYALSSMVLGELK